MNSTESIKELATALSKAQAKMKTADGSSVNKHYGNTYANISQVWEACRDALTSEGLSIIQATETTASGWVLNTTLMHSSGEWMESQTPLFLPQSPNMQHLGSAVTYAKRISLMAMAGISVGEVDDDGEKNRQDIEKSPPVTEDYKSLINELKNLLQSKGLKDEIIQFGIEQVEITKVNGLELLKDWIKNKDEFLKKYKEWLDE